jgi:hypothetical protein
MCKHVARYPTWVLATGAAIWAGGVLASCWLATWLGTGRHPAHGIVVGVLLLMLVGMNLAMLPYAPWFPIVMLVSFPISIYWGTKWGRGGVSRHEGSGIPKGK